MRNWARRWYMVTEADRCPSTDTPLPVPAYPSPQSDWWSPVSLSEPVLWMSTTMAVAVVDDDDVGV